MLPATVGPVPLCIYTTLQHTFSVTFFSGHLCHLPISSNHTPTFFSSEFLGFYYQGGNFSAHGRNSAPRGPIFVIFQISVNLKRNLKGCWGGGNSGTTWPTEMVHLSQCAGFHEGSYGNVFKIVPLSFP